MHELTEAKGDKNYRICKISGDSRFLSRIMSMGLVAGTELSVIQNVRSLPVLIKAMDTEIALNKQEAARILVEVV